MVKVNVSFVQLVIETAEPERVSKAEVLESRSPGSEDSIILRAVSNSEHAAIQRSVGSTIEAARVSPSRKYANEGGPGFAQITTLLNGSDEPEQDRHRLFRAARRMSRDVLQGARQGLGSGAGGTP